MRRTAPFALATVVLLAVFSGTTVAGWFLAGAVVSALALSVPLSVERYRREGNIARSLWRSFISR